MNTIKNIPSRFNGLNFEQNRLDVFPCIAVIIPAFQAEQHILKVLEGIPRFVSFIIVVDDCSLDNG